MSFARTGQAAMQNYIAANDAVASNSWDPNTLIKESIKARSAEKQAMVNKDASADIAESNKRGYIARVQSKLDTEKTALDMKKTQRKAGMVAAAGAQVAKGFIKTPDPIKPRERDFSGMEELIERGNADITAAEQRLADFQEQHKDILSKGQTPSTLSPAAPMAASGKFTGGTLNPNDALAIKATADRLGVDPYSLGGLFEMESGHRPNVWGGDGDNYKGLIQFGPGARSEVGLPDRDMTISEQLPYVEKYFNQRGFTPGKHGVTELYRTVLVGNPGQSGTDSFGTNSDAASKRMMPGGDLYQRAQKLYGSWQSD